MNFMILSTNHKVSVSKFPKLPKLVFHVTECLTSHP